MTVTTKKIKIDAEATTEGAVRAFNKLSEAELKAKKAAEGVGSALKKVRLEFQVQQARLKNVTERYAKFDAAMKSSEARLRKQASLAKRAGSSYSGFSSKLAGVGAAARTLGPSLAVGTAALAAGAIAASELAQESLQLQNIFKNIPFSLNAARRETKGLADDTVLAKNAIIANQAGVATTGEAYAKLVGQAQTLALKMGRDVNETVERVTLGLAKQEREILDELVIIPRMTDIWSDFAKQTGRTTAELSDQEKNTAFLESAQKALSDATQGVETDMDGAAGAIARATVEAKNMRAAVLGAEEKAATLKEGVTQLSAAQLRLALAAGDSRSAAVEVAAALDDLGVKTTGMIGKNVAMEKAIKKVVQSEERRLSSLAEKNKLSGEEAELAKRLIEAGAIQSDANEEFLRRELVRLGITNEQIAAQGELAEEDEAILGLKREALAETEEEIAFAKARGDEEQGINILILEQLELKAELLEAEGDLGKATKARRALELERVRQEGASKRRRGGGKRKDITFDLDKVFGNTEKALGRIEQQEARAMAALERTGKGASKRFQALTKDLERSRKAMEGLSQLFTDLDRRMEEGGLFQVSPELNPFSSANLEAQLGNVIDFEARRSQIVLDSRLREVQALEAAGVEPRQLLELESEAQLEHLTRVQASEQARFDREILLAEQQKRLADASQLRAEQEVSALEFQSQAEATQHGLAIARINERRRAEQDLMEKRIALVKLGADVTLQAAGAVARATILEGQALAKSVAGVAKSLAFEHGLKAVSEGVNAAIAVASYRYGAAGQHTANAAASAAVAATAAGVAAAAGASGGRGPSVSGFDSGNFGQGGSAGSSRQAANNAPTGRSADLGQGVPLSQETTEEASGQAANNAQGGTVVVTQNINVTTLGRPDDETMVKLAQGQRAAGNRVGRLSVGGRR